jgi:hypothetical protein
MSGSGTATIDFGNAPGSQIASVAVTGQSGILTTSSVEAFMMSNDSTADNTDFMHRMVPMRFKCGNIVAGTGFTIYAFSDVNVSKTWTVRWVWA